MIDRIYHYKGFGGCDCKCRLRVSGNVVIATELEDNEGTSITNLAEHLATQVIREFNIRPDKLVWVEHYQERGSKFDRYPEDFSLVHFEWDGRRFSKPEWKHVPGEAIETQLGVAI